MVCGKVLSISGKDHLASREKLGISKEEFMISVVFDSTYDYQRRELPTILGEEFKKCIKVFMVPVDKYIISC